MDEDEEEDDSCCDIIEEDSCYAEDCDEPDAEYYIDCDCADCDDIEDDSETCHDEDPEERGFRPETDRNGHHTPIFIHSGSDSRQPKIGIAEGIYGFVFVIAMILFFMMFL